MIPTPTERDDQHVLDDRQFEVDGAGPGLGMIHVLPYPVIGISGHGLVKILHGQGSNHIYHSLQIETETAAVVRAVCVLLTLPASISALTRGSGQCGVRFSILN